MSVRVEHGDMRQAIPRLVAEGVVCDAVVTDPPYHLTPTVKRFGKAGSAPAQFGKDGAMARLSAGFMQSHWDGGDLAFRPETWVTVASIMRPGAFLVAFGGTRTYHRLTCAIEDAGFVIQDSILDMIGSDARVQRFLTTLSPAQVDAFSQILDDLQPTGALAWAFGSGFPKRKDNLKPAFEPIVLAYKPGGKRTMQINECRISPLGDASENSTDSIDLLHRCDPRCCIRRTLHAWAEHGRPPIHLYSNDGGCARSWSSAINFPADCQSCHRFRDALIQMFQEADQEGPPSRLDARAGTDRHRKEWSHIRENLCSVHHAIWDDFLGSVSSCTYMQGRVGEASANRRYTANGSTNYAATPGPRGGSNLGRWPANLCHGSDEVVACFPESAGQRAAVKGTEPSNSTRFIYNGLKGRHSPREPTGDSGSAARFFFSAKASAQDRWGSKHPTVKPVELMKWLVALVTPPGGLVLDPFAGSGTTGVAALAAGRNAILIEREDHYIADIRERLAFYEGGGTHSMQAKNRNRKVDHGPLFERPYDPELDALESYNVAVKEIGERVKAGAPVPDFMLSRKRAAE